MATAVAQKPIFWPAVKPAVTEEYGTRGGSHRGMDLHATLNDPVLAAFDGVVVFVGGDGARLPLWLGDGWLYPKGEGKTVDIQRSDGLISRVGHLNGYAVSVGQTVKAGQVVGYAGTTGYSTGVHIHWELRWDRVWVGGASINPRSVNPQIYSATRPPVGPATKKRRRNKMDNVCLMMAKGIVNGKQNYLAKVFCLQTGVEHTFEADYGYVVNIAKTYGCTTPSIVSKSHYDKTTTENNATRAELDRRAKLGAK